MSDETDTPNLARRKLLGRVGLAAGAAYVAPVMLHLNAAHASGASRGNSGPSRGSRVSRASRGSRPRSRNYRGGNRINLGGANNDLERLLNRVFRGF